MSQDNGVDYKKKYEDLRARFIESLDVSFRAGYEQGSNDAQMQAMAAQQAQQAQQLAAQQNAMMGNQAGGNPEMSGQPDQGPSEMDAAIAELDSLVNKSEPSVDDLKKSIKSIQDKLMFAKLSKSTKEAGEKMKKSFNFSKSFTNNLNEDSKKAVSMQTKVVDDILKKWENEQEKSARDITSILGTQGLQKKE